MKAHIYWVLAIILFACACSDSPRQAQEEKVYQVNLDKKVNPLKTIFSHAEIIPLETQDSSLIIWMHKVYPVNDKFYVHDQWQHKLFVFGQNGQYQRRISRYGQGAGEYISMYDCVVDAPHDNIYMLSIFGRIKRYDLNGNFKDEVELPARPNYYCMELLDDNHVATWSCLEPQDGGVLVVNKTTGDSLRSDWHDDRMFDNLNHEKALFRYSGKTYFATALRQQVYEVTTSGLKPAYLWDFGKDNIRESRLEYYLSIENSNDRNNEIIDDIGTEGLPFILDKQAQNKTYSYLALQRETGMRPLMSHVFYHKEKEKALVFDFLNGKDCKMNPPLYFGDDYLLTDVLYDDRETFQSILPEEEYQKLENMLEDDNPCLLKLYFK